MGKMDGLIKEYYKKQEKTATDKGQAEQIKQWLNEFREIYGFSVSETSIKFKAFRTKKMAELVESKKKAKRLSKKQQSEKYLQELAEKGSGAKY